MNNIKTELKGDTLILTIDLTKKFGLSKTGKSEVIASTGGNVGVPGREEVKFGLNVYTSAPK